MSHAPFLCLALVLAPASAALAGGSEPVGTPYCVASPNASGAAAWIEAEGSNRVADNNLTLVSHDMPVGSFGIFMASRAQGFFPGAGLGTLCLGGDIGFFRQAPQIRRVDRTRSFSLELDLNLLPVGPTLRPAEPGQTWFFQAWFRDGLPGAGGFASHNFSNGVSVSFG